MDMGIFLCPSFVPEVLQKSNHIVKKCCIVMLAAPNKHRYFPVSFYRSRRQRHRVLHCHVSSTAWTYFPVFLNHYTHQGTLWMTAALLCLQHCIHMDIFLCPSILLDVHLHINKCWVVMLAAVYRQWTLSCDPQVFQTSNLTINE